jgi:leucyl aminopeptidase
MLACFTDKTEQAIPITLVLQENFQSWLTKQDHFTQQWLSNIKYIPTESPCVIPNQQGNIECVLCCPLNNQSKWFVGQLPIVLPNHHYYFEDTTQLFHYAIVWGLGAYQFSHYKKPKNQLARL